MQRKMIDCDTKRAILMKARARTKLDITRKPQVDFVAEQVCAAYNIRITDLRGTALGADVDRLGEMLRREMLTASLKVVALREKEAA